eukprot:TRINITY_DN1071_c0_g1_i1.p1 TRINITY_DN1071_c0_g1~~TRINITY_DN1071_c0_g1_i1.p1  ORF type:complete len:729 (+),score=122.78 TRINITY_DN1071_c0_g1_i1:250-2187(+)
MFGQIKSQQDTTLKLLDAPVNLAEDVREVEAQMSLFVYQPKIERGMRARGEQMRLIVNPAVDHSDEAQAKRDKREKREREKRARAQALRDELMNARRDVAVVAPRSRSKGAVSRDLKLLTFDLDLAGKQLLKDASLQLSFGRRYGLVGRNGMGKTTLLRHIAGRDIPGLPDSMQILHVEQEAVGSDTTVLDSVLEADIERAALLKEEKEILAVKKDGGDDMRLVRIYQRLEEIDADKAEARASAILAGLGFSAAAQQRPTREFSGGWRMRMALSRALFCQPDLLLLDEPTNMLDIQAVLWLENYLQTWPHTLLVVSHDRTFLNNVVTDIIHLNHQTLTPYHGDYDTFEKTRMERLKNQHKALEAQEKQRAHVQQFIDKFRFNAKRASLVQSRIKMLNKMDIIPALIDDPTCSFTFPEPEELPPPLIQFDEVYFSYDKGRQGRTEPENIFNKITFDLDMDSRIALVGANGAGKTTLLKLITGELKQKAGNLFIHRRIRFATFSQHHVDQLDMDLTPLEFFIQNFPGSDPQVYRAHLGRYGLSGDLALQPTHTLSGGQKSRVAFAIMGWLKPHFLILDEPTNHLDVETVDVLAMALNSFTGGLVMVSHDERLITNVCNELWVVNDGLVYPHSGDFASYKKTILSKFT